MFPSGVCDYSKPGKGFQPAVTWLTYQDAGGKVVYGGAALGASPLSTVAGTVVLPATGGDASFAPLAVVLLAAAALVRRMRRPFRF